VKKNPEWLIRRRKITRYFRQTIDSSSFPHEITKKCKDCKQEKKCKWNSNFTLKGKPEYIARCNDCFKLYQQKIRRKPETKRNRNLAKFLFQKKRKKYAIERLGGRCKICGYNKSLAALIFHHKNPKDKKFTVGHLLDHSLENLNKELDKCELLCFNCHAETHEKINYENYQNRFNEGSGKVVVQQC
jgi:hypothetical protein